MYEVHPGQEVVCGQCSFTCPNYNYLKLHKTMFHFANSPQTSVPTTQTNTSFDLKQMKEANRPMVESPPQIMVLPPSRPAMQLPAQVINAAAVAAAEAARSTQLQPIQKAYKSKFVFLDFSEDQNDSMFYFVFEQGLP